MFGWSLSKVVTLIAMAAAAWYLFKMLGGSRMQYHMRMTLTTLEAFLFIKPEVFVSFAPKKFDEKTLELTDQPTIDMVKQQLAGFEKFIRRLNGKA